MDWVFKASSSSSWDLSELERDEFDVLQQVMGNNPNMEAEPFSADSGITLGPSSTMAMASPEPGSGSSKKPRGDDVSCLVDGCTADLSSCRDYHRRHRVCEAHSKTPVVAIAGKHQRFCQQCSRFHSVGEFDEVKRSCRKRLDGHNRRRRKPRGIESSMYETFFTNHQGTKLVRFGGSPAYTTCSGPVRMRWSWPTDKEKSNQQLHVSVVQQNIFTPSSSSSSSREKKFPFLLGTDASVVQRLFEPKPKPKPKPNANGALSLLSNNTTPKPNYLTIPHLPFPNYVTGLNSSCYTTTTNNNNNNNDNNNHLIRMIHFRTEERSTTSPLIFWED